MSRKFIALTITIFFMACFKVSNFDCLGLEDVAPDCPSLQTNTLWTNSLRVVPIPVTSNVKGGG